MSPRAIALGLTMGLVLSPCPLIAQTSPTTGGHQQDRQTGVDQLTTSTVVRRAQQNTAQSSQAASNQTNGEPQIALSRRDVNAPGGISNAADSRGGVAMVEGGVDRCDPARATSAQASCRDVIENRSAEFAHTVAPTISPESVLLAANRHAGITTANVGEQTTSSPVDAEQRSNQELATVVLNQQQQQQQAPTTSATNQPSLDANQQAIVNAVVQSITRGN